MNIAFYAPMKPPDHAVPSGDRHMARALIRALESLGHEVTPASGLRTWSGAPDPLRLAALQADSGAEAARIVEEFRPAPRRPALWMTYHLFFKAPDLIGPAVAKALAIPYVTVEASYAGKRSRDGWAPWQGAVEPALRAAALHFCITPRDRDGLLAFLGPDAPLLMLPPFLADLPEARAEPAARRAPGPMRLIAVGMMRPGTKLASYTFLAQTLPLLLHLDWHLTIVGDGPLRASITALFDTLPASRITWRMARGAQEVAALLAQSDILVWPGVNEAFGVTYLEAQAVGLPVVALDNGGVGECVRDGVGGVLVGDISPQAYAQALSRLMADPASRARLGEGGRRFVRAERTLEAAARRLHDGLAPLLRGSAA